MMVSALPEPVRLALEGDVRVPDAVRGQVGRDRSRTVRAARPGRRGPAAAAPGRWRRSRARPGPARRRAPRTPAAARSARPGSATRSRACAPRTRAGRPRRSTTPPRRTPRPFGPPSAPSRRHRGQRGPAARRAAADAEPVAVRLARLGQRQRGRHRVLHVHHAPLAAQPLAVGPAVAGRPAVVDVDDADAAAGEEGLLQVEQADDAARWARRAPTRRTAGSSPVGPRSPPGWPAGRRGRARPRPNGPVSSAGRGAGR